MMFKCFLVLVALSSIPIQAHPQRSTLGDLLTELLEVYKTIQEAGIVDISAVLQEFATTEQLAKILIHLLDNYSDILPPEAICLLEVVANSDVETQVTAEEFIRESIKWIRLVQQREQELRECDELLGENPNAWAVIQHQSCRLQVEATTGVAVTVSAARARLLFWELRGIYVDGLFCFTNIDISLR